MLNTSNFSKHFHKNLISLVFVGAAGIAFHPPAQDVPFSSSASPLLAKLFQECKCWVFMAEVVAGCFCSNQVNSLCGRDLWLLDPRWESTSQSKVAENK